MDKDHLYVVTLIIVACLSVLIFVGMVFLYDYGIKSIEAEIELINYHREFIGAIK